ncbi:hypothetical protein L3Q82_002252 [Scortum barcoo]|uniref:Uncharacterized protein n=1 Tax=Scortum barcoo TaxID=214431 RepID=A0ACB8VY82_9TELE|nr:hypothetical protein L3Q82_002252 [Scortum barcoo]
MPPGRLPREVFQACPTGRRPSGKTQDTLEERLCLSRLAWERLGVPPEELEEVSGPWPVEGTLNPDVVKTMKVLVSTYKADQKKGKKGEKRKEKRQMELGILQLFEEEGQRLIEAAKEKFDQVKKPPPYEKEVKFKEIYSSAPCDLPRGKLPNKR